MKRKQSIQQIVDYCFRYRFLIAFIIFVLCIAFEITGSSIGCWLQVLGYDDSDILYGQSLPIRSDEWAVSTPILWSQYNAAEPFQRFNSVLRGCETDAFMLAGQPIRSILMLFRPLQWGYLFLPLAKGMAFFWCGGLIALFLVSFEFGRVITDDDRKLAFVYAIAVTLAPPVAWWRMIDFPLALQLSIVMMQRYMQSDKPLIRIIAACVITICAGTYIFTFYPAWMVPFGYVLLGLILYVFFQNFKNFRMHIYDGVLIGACALALGGMLWLWFSQSADAIQTISNTVYPGERISNGGGGLHTVFEYIINIWFPRVKDSPYANVCELSRFIDLFPLCWILPIYAMVRSRKKDTLSCLLLAASALLYSYIVHGIPGFLAKYTMLGNTTTGRAVVSFGFCNLILLIRGIKLYGECDQKKILLPAILGGVLSLAVFWTAYAQCIEYFSVKMTIFTIAAFFSLFAAALLSHRRWGKNLFCLGMIAIMLISGTNVSPVRSGIDSVENIPEFSALRQYSKKDTLWVVEGLGLPYFNMPIMVGLPTLNSTNLYPTMDRWGLIDPSGEYADVYNRYAHIAIKLTTQEERDIVFSAPHTDVVVANLTVEELKLLGVTHILTTSELEGFAGVELLEQLDSNIQMKIYCISQ